MRDIQEGYKEYTIMSLIWREGQLKDVSAIHLGSSLSQAEEQGALFAGGGPVKILVELNRAGGVASPGDGSAKMATSVGGGRAADSALPYWSVGRACERSDWSKTTGQTCRSSCATDFDNN